MALDVSISSLFDVRRVEGEELGVDLDGLGVDQAAQVAQEGVVWLGNWLRGWCGRRHALLQDLEALVQVVLQMEIVNISNIAFEEASINNIFSMRGTGYPKTRFSKDEI